MNRWGAPEAIEPKNAREALISWCARNGLYTNVPVFRELQRGNKGAGIAYRSGVFLEGIGEITADGESIEGAQDAAATAMLNRLVTDPAALTGALAHALPPPRPFSLWYG